MKERFAEFSSRFKDRFSGGSSNGGTSARDLSARRDELRREFASIQWDLGGIAYEMAARDHYRLDVLNKVAARLQEVDAQLGQIERLSRLEETGVAGNCPSCSAPQAQGAMFCWQCGEELVRGAKVAGSS